MNKVEDAIQEYADWCSALGVDSMDILRKVMELHKTVPLINICEARQERKYAEIANQILWKKDECRIVMISGPSSSGKTSSSLRIAQQCRVVGLVPKVIELDNYFVNRERNPRTPDGKYDFEALEALDIEFLGIQLNALLNGEEIELPHFDFVSGKRQFEGRKMRLNDGDILFMEGIHALNPAMTPTIDSSKFFKIYVSALSALPGENNQNSSSDKRLLRRIVRDNRNRGKSPEATILMWPSVRAGEVRNIFPYQDNADIVFNSSMLYDLPLLKYYAQPLLDDIPSDSPARAMADHLTEYMGQIDAVTPEDIAAIPPTSIMREFIGGQMLF